MKFENIVDIIVVGCSVGMFGSGGIVSNMMRGYDDLDLVNVLFAGIGIFGIVMIFSKVKKLGKFVKENREIFEKEI